MFYKYEIFSYLQGGSEQGKEQKKSLAAAKTHPEVPKDVSSLGKKKKQPAQKNNKSAGTKKKSVGQKKKSAKKASVRQSSGSCLAPDCLDLAVTYLGLLRTKVTNYQKQTSRLSKLGVASSSKSAKQTVFSNSLNQLITAGGGNASSLACGASTNNTGTTGDKNSGYSTVGTKTQVQYVCTD